MEGKDVELVFGKILKIWKIRFKAVWESIAEGSNHEETNLEKNSEFLVKVHRQILNQKRQILIKYYENKTKRIKNG